MLMNDNMIREIAHRWPELEASYQLSWAPCRTQVIRLTDKESLEQRCKEAKLNYPKTWTVAGLADLEKLPSASGAQFIVKPALPLGGFKARRANSVAAVRDLVEKFGASLPFLTQEWIPGDDRRIQFSAVYFEKGRVLSRFDGRKIESLPPALGQAIIVEGHQDDEVFEATLRFFAGLNLTGPASLELKRAPDGSLWVIEPTIGRTDTHFQAWLANGINAALVEYCSVLGLQLPPLGPPSGKIWFDTERDPLCFLRHAKQYGFSAALRAAEFPYTDITDPAPFLHSTYSMLLAYLRRRLP